jgi:uncharacterized membrane protein YfcA
MRQCHRSQNGLPLSQLWLGSVIAVISIFGMLVGTYVRRLGIDERRFNWIVVAILSVIALNILSDAVPVLFC